MKRKKNALWLALLIAIPLIATSIMIDVAEASPIKVYVDPPEILNTNLVPGEEFTVSITVDYVKELSAYQFELSFNPDVIHGVSVENGPFLGSAGGDVMIIGGNIDNAIGKVELFGGILYPPDVSNPTGEYGVLASITFEVVGIGSSPIRLSEEKDVTLLVNKTGGTQFNGETAEAWIRIPGELPIPNPGFLGHGYFDNRPQVYVEPRLKTAVSIGENFTVNVNVVNITDLYSWEFYMNWTAPLLNVTSVGEGSFLKSQPGETQFHQEIHNDEGYIYVNCMRTDASGVSDSGTLANVTFLVEDEGNSTLHLYNTILLNSAGGTISVGITDGWFNNVKFRNIAIKAVTPYPTQVDGGSGDPIYVNVTVGNTGSFNETGINVAAYYDENEIGTETGISLDKGTDKTFTFMWNTTGVSVGKYTLSANATILEGEINTDDNTRVYGIVTVSGINIAIISVETSVSNAYLGHNVSVIVTVENQGTEVANFNVTAYYQMVGTEGHGEIGKKIITGLGYKESKALQFEWDTAGLELGEYTLSANATILEGEINTDDNTRTKEGTLRLVPAPEQSFFTPAVSIGIIAAIIIVGSATLFYIRRKKLPEA